MAFRKPFRAVPVKLGPRYQRLQRAEERAFAVRLLGGAALVGALGGIVTTNGGPARIAGFAHALAVDAGIVRARPPRAGDYWRGCDEARAAGSAPLYVGEPGYREGMDGDHDGIACEPYR